MNIFKRFFKRFFTHKKNRIEKVSESIYAVKETNKEEKINKLK